MVPGCQRDDLRAEPREIVGRIAIDHTLEVAHQERNPPAGLRVTERLPPHVGGDGARLHDKGPYAIGPRLRVHVLGQADHRCLGDTIGGQIRCDDDPAFRGDVDDAARATRPHSGQHRTHEEQSAADVNRMGPPPVIGVDVTDRAVGPRQASVVDQYRDGSELAFRLCDARLDFASLGHVGDDRKRATALGLDHRSRFVELAARARHESDPRPGAGEMQRDRAPESATAAGHQRGPALELSPHRRHRRPRVEMPCAAMTQLVAAASML